MDLKMEKVLVVIIIVFTNCVFSTPINIQEEGVSDYSKTCGYISETSPNSDNIENTPSESKGVNGKSSIIEKPAEFRLFSTRNKWPKKRINWHVSRYTNQISQEDQREAFRKALKVWGDVSQLEFSEQSEDVDIEIKFVTRDHGDDSSFDGPSRGRQGTILAHAFAPGGSDLAGDAHFDNDEEWTTDINSEYKTKKYLELIAAHEFGHSLGLDHSQDTNALMNAYYVNSQRQYQLSDDDINGIQHLYGSPNGWEPRTTPKPTTPPPIPVCHNLFKAVVWGKDQRTYGIYDDKVVELVDHKYVVSIPRSLQQIFPNSPIGVDFATTLPDSSSTYMFRGYSVWKFNGYELDKNYPTMFDVRDFPEMPLGVLSVVEGNHNTIFMYGPKQFWRWDPEQIYAGKRYLSHASASYWSINLSSYNLVTTWTNGDIYLINYNSHVILKDRNIVKGYPKEGVPVWLQNGCRSGSSKLIINIHQIVFIIVLSYLISL